MHLLIAGSSGFLGSHLRTTLQGRGHRVTRLVRGTASGADERSWSPYDAPLDPADLDDVDVVVNLAGSPTLGNPHSQTWATQLETSRVTTTRVLAEAIVASDRKPALLAGNGISYYGDHGEELLDETADSRGDALLTRVTRVWQEAAEPVAESGGRLVVLRTSPVLDRRAAPLKQQTLLFRMSLGGPIGHGRQWFPCLSLTDWVNAVCFCAEHPLSGPVNLTLPIPTTNGEFTRVLARAVHRPAVLGVPAVVVKTAAGPMAPEVLGSVRAVPQVLTDAGFQFSHPDISRTINAALHG